jgi:transcriptional regulator with XRE-family HTH domain
MASEEEYVAEEARLLALLSEIAKQRRMSIRAMEVRAGVGVSVFSRIFSGKIRPSLRHILRMCDALELPWAELYALAAGAKPSPPMDELEARVIALLKRLGWQPPQGWPAGFGEQ